MQDRSVEVDLLPAQIDNLARTQSMPKCEEDHERVAMAPTIALRCLDELLDLSQG
jgi:hypothetical protein